MTRFGQNVISVNFYFHKKSNIVGLAKPKNARGVLKQSNREPTTMTQVRTTRCSLDMKVKIAACKRRADESYQL